MLAVLKREFSSYFTSPLGFIVIALYMLISGFFFWMMCFLSGYNNLAYVINYMLNVVFFLIPLITMKSFAEEMRQRTDQALLTAPVRLSEIVMGKFLSAFSLYLICNCVYFVYALVIIICAPGTAMDWGMFFSSWFGILLLGSALLSVNIFYSSLTESQIIAAVIGLGTGLLLMLYDSIISALNNFINTLFSVEYKMIILDKLSLTTHYQNFTSGIFDPSDVIFFISWVVLFLFLTLRVLDKKRWA